MTEFSLSSPFSPSGDQPKTIKTLVNGIKRGEKEQVLLGITGSGKTFTMANIIQEMQKPTIILSHNKTLASQLYGEFKSLFPHNAVEFFISYYDYYQPEAYMPITDTFIEKDSSIDDEINRLRLKATTSLASRKDVIIIASVSCIYGIGSPDSYKDMLISLSRGETVNIKTLFRRLVDNHYMRNDLVLEPGIFRLRGDIIEIYPAYEDHPLRIELFGDEIEKIYFFNSITSEIIDDLENCHIYPAKHFVTSRDILENAMSRIRIELGERLIELRKNNMLLEAQRLEQRTLFDLEMMMELGYCSGIENYSRHIDGRKEGERPCTLLDFFSEDYLMFIDESHVSIPQVNAMYKGDRSRKMTLVEHGFRLASALDNRPMKFSEFEKKINQVIYVSATPGKYELERTKGVVVEQIIRPTGLLDPKLDFRPSKGQINDIIIEINKVVKRGERILITTLTKKMSEKLTEYLKGVGIKAEYMHSDIDTISRIKILRGLRMKNFDVLVGINLLREGLDLPEVSLIVVLDADKEGFLRSRTSLLQISGRASRNVNGKVILYGDRMTDSMKHLFDETERRRKLQEKFNKINNIVPQTIKKSRSEILATTQVADKDVKNSLRKDKDIEIDADLDTFSMDEIEIMDLMKKLDKKMKVYARNLQFEEAAILRDKVINLEKKIADIRN